MAILETALDPSSPQFTANREFVEKSIAAMRTIQQKVIDKSFAAKPKFEKRGQILPHEACVCCWMRETPFVELLGLVGYGMYDDKDGSDAGGGIIAGIGFVNGMRCMVTASNSAIKGGTISPAGMIKTLRLHEIIKENKLPVICLTESGGANLNYGGEIFVNAGRTFANQARLSAMGIPQISVVHGNATAGGAYQPGLSDYIIVIRKRTQMFLITDCP